MLPEQHITSLDVMLEKQIKDYWNVDGERNYLMHGQASQDLCFLLKERPPEGYTWSGRRLTRKETNSRLDDVWPDM